MGGDVAGTWGGATAQLASIPTMAAAPIRQRTDFMGLILLEALGALVLLLFIVWWTMFSGRKRGELPDAPAPSPDAVADAPTIESEKK